MELDCYGKSLSLNNCTAFQKRKFRMISLRIWMNWKTGFKISLKILVINSTLSQKILWHTLMLLFQLNNNLLINIGNFSWNLQKSKNYYQITNKKIAKAMTKTNKVWVFTKHAHNCQKKNRMGPLRWKNSVLNVRTIIIKLLNIAVNISFYNDISKTKITALRTKVLILSKISKKNNWSKENKLVLRIETIRWVWKGPIKELKANKVNKWNKALKEVYLKFSLDCLRPLKSENMFCLFYFIRKKKSFFLSYIFVFHFVVSSN